MYSTVGLLKNSKLTGKLTGTHQKLDGSAYYLLVRNLTRKAFFPKMQNILHFEGTRGPDGLKRKSPGEDEPSHFFIKGQDEDLIQIILDHQYNLREAIKKRDEIRSAFEAAWLAHAITDGLTPAHHFPLKSVAEELMTDKEFFTIFGEPIKGIMHGRTKKETLKNNWEYWGFSGQMSHHIAFEFGCALVAAPTPIRKLVPSVDKKIFKNIDLEAEFRASVDKIMSLDLYNRFTTFGWTTDVSVDVQRYLLPEIVRMIAVAWASAIPDEVKK